jgi:dihydropteroate synthase
MQRDPHYDDVVADVRAFLDGRARAAEAAGVTEVWVDPGIGFGKTTAHNLELLANVDLLVSDGRPVLVGTSRKRSLGVLAARSDAGLPPLTGLSDTGSAPGQTGDVEPSPVLDRLEGSLATASWAIIRGVRMVRAHDVGPTVRAAEVICRELPGVDRTRR